MKSLVETVHINCEQTLQDSSQGRPTLSEFLFRTRILNLFLKGRKAVKGLFRIEERYLFSFLIIKSSDSKSIIMNLNASRYALSRYALSRNALSCYTLSRNALSRNVLY